MRMQSSRRSQAGLQTKKIQPSGLASGFESSRASALLDIESAAICHELSRVVRFFRIGHMDHDHGVTPANGVAIRALGAWGRWPDEQVDEKRKETPPRVKRLLAMVVGRTDVEGIFRRLELDVNVVARKSETNHPRDGTLGNLAVIERAQDRVHMESRTSLAVRPYSTDRGVKRVSTEQHASRRQLGHE